MCKFIKFNDKIININNIRYIEKITGLGQYINQYGIKVYLDKDIFFKFSGFDEEQRDREFEELFNELNNY